MISLNDFIENLQESVDRFAVNLPNDEQLRCVLSDLDSPLLIGAGPGSGKTTVLVLRALKHIFVDGLIPESIVITTFTTKAASEIRSRLVEWGLEFAAGLNRKFASNPVVLEKLAKIDINRCVTGTLDSICEDILSRYRDPTDSNLNLIDGFVSEALFLRSALWPQRAIFDRDFQSFLSRFTNDGGTPGTTPEKIQVLVPFVNRLIYDNVKLDDLKSATVDGANFGKLISLADAYWKFLAENYCVDFPNLERNFLARLSSGRLERFCTGIHALLIDEYQDTNPLQEEIYFEIYRQSKCGITVVGDDDQSIYRFRGATVELFSGFLNRFSEKCNPPQVPLVNFLFRNYRSTDEIVEYFNRFVNDNRPFQSARLKPGKPDIISVKGKGGIPVLGLFRSTREELAKEVAGIIDSVFQKDGFRRKTHLGRDIDIQRAGSGSVGDAVLLAHSVNELSSGGTARLPLALRTELRGFGIDVFNPRGRRLTQIREVRVMLGLLVLCIDKDDTFASLGFGPAISNQLREFRRDAMDFIAINPFPSSPHTLADFVNHWKGRRPQGGRKGWPKTIPILELVFKLLAWFPWLRDDPEGQIYLEAITRAVTEAASFSPFEGKISFDSNYENNSIKSFLNDIAIPLILDKVAIDEDVMPYTPRDRFPIMTIHQAKGLEFPLVFVDVASDFRTDHRMQRFRRFPSEPSNVHHMEDALAPFSSVGSERTKRNAIERTFDDLMRLYYVAYSRPESVLVLLGLDRALNISRPIQNVATGWSSDGSWSWLSGAKSKKSPIPDRIPLELI